MGGYNEKRGECQGSFNFPNRGGETSPQNFDASVDILIGKKAVKGAL